MALVGSKVGKVRHPTTGKKYKLHSTYNQRLEKSKERHPNRTANEHNKAASGGKFTECRKLAGYINPKHMSKNMLPLFERAAGSPIPENLNQKQLKAHFEHPKRSFRTQSPSGRDTGVVQGHGKTVLGHKVSAGEHFNKIGHTKSRDEIEKKNKKIDMYHGLESRKRSDASGAHEQKYGHPTPEAGSHDSRFNPHNPKYIGTKGDEYVTDSESSSTSSPAGSRPPSPVGPSTLPPAPRRNKQSRTPVRSGQQPPAGPSTPTPAQRPKPPSRPRPSQAGPSKPPSRPRPARSPRRRR